MPQTGYNEEALNHAYNLFKQDGYSKSVDEFKKVISDNPEALVHAYNLFKEDGYEKDIHQFSELLGVKKSTPPQGGTSVKPVLSSGGISKTSSSGNTASKLPSSNAIQTQAKKELAQNIGAYNFQQAYAKQLADKTGESQSDKFKTYSNMDNSQEAKTYQAQEKQKGYDLAAKIARDEAYKKGLIKGTYAPKEVKLIKGADGKEKLEEIRPTTLGDFTEGAKDLGKAVGVDKVLNASANALDDLFKSFDEVAQKDTFKGDLARGTERLVGTVLQGYSGLQTGFNVLEKDLWNTIGVDFSDLEKKATQYNQEMEAQGLLVNPLKVFQNKGRAIIDQVNQVDSGIAKGNKYEGSAWDALKNGDISEFADLGAKMFANSLPMMAAYMSPTGIAAVVGGGISEAENEANKEGKEFTTNDVVGSVLKTGLEVVLSKLLGNQKQIESLVAKVGAKKASELVANATKEVVKKSLFKEVGKGVAKNVGEEMFEEGLTTIGQNAVDKYILGKDVDVLNKDVINAVIGGAFGGGLGSPVVALNTYIETSANNAKAQQLNQEYNESKSSNEGQAIEGNVSESGIISEGQGDRQSEGLQGGEQSGLEIGQNASDENGSQEVTTSQGITETTLESEGETSDSNVDTETESQITKTEGIKIELPDDNTNLTYEELDELNKAIPDKLENVTVKLRDKVVKLKKHYYDKMNGVLGDLKTKADELTQKYNELLKADEPRKKGRWGDAKDPQIDIVKKQLSETNKAIKDLFYAKKKVVKWLSINEKDTHTDIENEILNTGEKISDAKAYDIIGRIIDQGSSIFSRGVKGAIKGVKDAITINNQKVQIEDIKNKYNKFRQGINDVKADKKKVITEFINAIDPKANISPRQLGKILNAINTGKVNTAIKLTLSLANSTNKSILAKEFNAVKQALKKVKFATVTDNNKLVKKLTQIGSIPDVFKEDYIKEVGALLDTYKKQGRFNTKEAQRLIDKYTPIWEETKTQNQLTRDVNLIASELDGTAIRDLDFIKEIRDAKSEFEKTLTDKGKLPSKKAVNDFVNNLIENLTVDQINEAVSLQKQFEQQEIAKLNTEEKVTPSEEQKQKALAAAESILDDIDYIINNTDIEGFDKYKDLTAEDIAGVLLLGNGKFDKAKFRNINEVLKNMYNGIDAAVNQVTGLLDASVRMKNKSSIKWGDINIKSLRDNAKNIIEKIGGVIAHYKGVHSKLLKIANNNIQRVQQIEELIGRDDAFKKRTQDIININDKFNDFLNNIRGGIGNIFTDKVDSRKQQTIARILSQLLQIPVNLDNEAQIAYVKKRISEVLKSQSTLTKGVEDGYTNDQKQEMQAHKDVLSALENLGIKIEDGSITEIPFESFDDFESAIKGIEAFKKHNELLTKIANFLQTEGYSDIMEEHSWKDYGRTLEKFTNYIPFFYSSPKDISNKDLFVSGGNLAGNIASAVKQRMGLGANQYMAGDFLVSLDTTHQQSITDALFCKGNIVTDNILNSNKIVDIFNQGATKNEAGYNQGVIVAKTLKNIFSEYNQVAKFGSLKDGNETQPVLDAFAKLQSLGNKIALSNVKLFFSQTPSQFVTVIGQMMKHMINTKGNFDALKNILPIIPLYMQNSARGRFAYMAGIGSIINEVNDLQVGDEGKWWNISTGTKVDEVSNAIGVASRTVGKVQTNYNKYNTAMADFMSRSMIFYLAAQSYAHQAGIDITANDFWDVMENGYANEDPAIMRIVEKAKYDSNLQGDLTKPTQSKAQTSTKATSRLFKLTLGNMKGFSVLQQEALINRTKIAFSPNNTNTMKDRFDAGMDVFTILAANFTYGITRVGAGMAAKTATVGILGFALSLIKGDDDEEDKDGVVKRIDHLLEEIRNTKHDPINMKDLMFIGTTSAIGSTLPSYLGLDEMSTYSLSEMGVYEGIRKVYDPQYKYLKETDEAHKGNTKYELGKTVQFMEQGVMPFTGGSILEMPKLTFINDTWDLCRSFKNVMADETLSPYAKDYYKKGLRIACARALSYVPVANIPSLIGNTLGLDSRLDQEFKESVKVADAIEGVDKWGNKNEGKGGLRVGIGSLEKEAKGNYISKNRVESLRQKGDSNSSGILINQADREIIRDYRIKNTK